MKDEKTNRRDYDSKNAEHEGDSPKKNKTMGEDIPYADNIPPTLISGDSKNTIAEQGHEGSDNNPDSSRVRNNQ